MKPAFITFTGVDADTDPAEMLMLDNDYPGLIEWGILFSPKRQGLEPRYPKLDAIHWQVEELGLRYAAHLCGQDARDVINTGASRHDNVIRHFFMRAQINTSEHVSPIDIAAWAEVVNVEPILQCRASFPMDETVSWLFDQSGGRGVETTIWPQPLPVRMCGYAGGLNPGNVAEKIRAMVAGSPNANYWIDMESGVRDENDSFSIVKCRAVCEAVYGKPQVAA